MSRNKFGMKKKTPKDVERGKRFGQAIEESDYDKSQIQTELKYKSRDAINKWCEGRSIPGSRRFRLFCKLVKKTETWFLEGDKDQSPQNNKEPDSRYCIDLKIETYFKEIDAYIILINAAIRDNNPKKILAHMKACLDHAEDQFMKREKAERAKKENSEQGCIAELVQKNKINP